MALKLHKLLTYSYHDNLQAPGTLCVCESDRTTKVILHMRGTRLNTNQLNCGLSGCDFARDSTSQFLIQPTGFFTPGISSLLLRAVKRRFWKGYVQYFVLPGSTFALNISWDCSLERTGQRLFLCLKSWNGILSLVKVCRREFLGMDAGSTRWEQFSPLNVTALRRARQPLRERIRKKAMELFSVSWQDWSIGCWSRFVARNRETSLAIFNLSEVFHRELWVCSCAVSSPFVAISSFVNGSKC